MTSEALCWAYETPLPETVTPTVHAVLLALCYSRHHANGQCNPGIQRLAELTRLSTSTVKEAIRVLKAANLIALTSGSRLRKSNSYAINYTAVAQKPPKARAKSEGGSKQTAKAAAADAAAATGADRRQGRPYRGIDGRHTDLNKGCQAATEYNKGNVDNSNVYNSFGDGSSSSSLASGKGSGSDDDDTAVTPPSSSPVPRQVPRPAGRVRPKRRLTYAEAKNFVSSNFGEITGWVPDKDDCECQIEFIEILAHALTLYKEVTKDNLRELVRVGLQTMNGMYHIAKQTGIIKGLLEAGLHVTNMHKYLMTCLKNRQTDF